MPKDTEIGIIEMGANFVGDIKGLVNICEPTHGLITNIGKAHLEGFGGIEGVKKGKGELYDWLSEHNGTVFLNAENEIRAGTLLWFYSSHEGFVFQWTLINLLWGFIVLLFWHFKFFQKKNLGPWGKEMAFLGFMLFFNIRCFDLMPNGLIILFWFPCLLIIPVYFILFIYKNKK